MSYNFIKSREQRLARIAKQKAIAQHITHTAHVIPDVVEEEVPLVIGEDISIEEVTPVTAEQPEQVKEQPVTPPRSTQNVLDSIVGMLFAQHHTQIHNYMMELEKQIIAEQNAIAEKHKLDNSKIVK